jgi:glycosyltransferase involved in cell wall biosynthesis
VKPSISFIVPAYNESAELPATLCSIHEAAQRTGSNYEVVVVDDASSDETAELARGFDARVVSISRRQIAASRNAGARAAHGGILIFVDADTHIRPEHVRGVLAALKKNYAGGGARVVIAGEVPRWPRISVRIFSFVYFGLNLGAGAFLFTTRENFFAVGGFDEQYFAGEEVLFSLALRKLGRFLLLPTPVITSGRKLRIYSPAKILHRTIMILLGGRSAVTSRRKLDLWYGGEREQRSS